jgi:hypothetical protein
MSCGRIIFIFFSALGPFLRFWDLFGTFLKKGPIDIILFSFHISFFWDLGTFLVIKSEDK